jgi:hypothetical protein
MVQNMTMVDVQLSMAPVPEWDAEDLLPGEPGDEVPEMTDEEKKQFPEGLRLKLPGDIAPTELTGYTINKATPISLEGKNDGTDFNFSLIQVPLQIIISDERLRIVKLRLNLQIPPESYNGVPNIAYDVYPRSLTQEDPKNTGGVHIDFGKALNFLLGGRSLGEVPGITVTFPQKWKTTSVPVQAAGLQSNPAEWLVTDTAIQNGFHGYAIIRAPEPAQFDITAHGVFQLIWDRAFSRKKRCCHVRYTPVSHHASTSRLKMR